METHDYRPGDQVSLIDHDWLAGEVRLAATVIAIEASGRVRVRVEAGMERRDFLAAPSALGPATGHGRAA